LRGTLIIEALETNATESGVNIYLDIKVKELPVEDGGCPAPSSSISPGINGMR